LNGLFDIFFFECAIIFADKYPDLEKFNHDKRVNWEKIKGILNEKANVTSSKGDT